MPMLLKQITAISVELEWVQSVVDANLVGLLFCVPNAENREMNIVILSVLSNAMTENRNVQSKGIICIIIIDYMHGKLLRVNIDH